MNSKKIIIGLLLLSLLLGVGVWLKKGNAKQGKEVETENVQKRTITETVTASGKIYPENEVKISPDVSGEVIALYIKEGDSVKAGQILAKIKPDVYQPQLERAQAAASSSKAQAGTATTQIPQLEANKSQIQAQLENANTILNRNDGLYKEGIISLVELEASRTSVKALEAQIRAIDAQITTSRQNIEAANYNVKGAMASVKEANSNLSRTTIYAPVSGIVSKLNIEKGERVVGTLQMAGTEIMRISNFSSLEVQVDVSENDILRVAVGNDVDIEVDAYLDKKFTGKVTEIASSAKESALAAASSDQTTNFVVKIRMDAASYAELAQNKRSPFLPGMSASVEIKTNRIDNTLSVPIQAVATREEGEDTKEKEGEKNKKPDDDIGIVSDKKIKTEKKKLQEVVFLMVGDSAVQRVVKTGIQDDSYIQITDGLTENDVVIFAPYTLVSRELKTGDKVRLKEETEE